MKMAPLFRALQKQPGCPPPVLVHTGQHYDAQMSQRFFDDLGMPYPDINLEVGSASHAVQTAEVMKRFEPVVDAYRPACVIVAGDVNSTLACGLVSVKKSVPVAHVEAGLRSFDRTMPEEINRVLTDQISDLLFTTEKDAERNLLREGIPSERIHFVGNLMIDSLREHLHRAIPPETTLRQGGHDHISSLTDTAFAVVTLHRPSNVDDAHTLRHILTILSDVSERLLVIWPIHPRTRANLDKFGLAPVLRSSRICTLPPQGYLEMLGLMRSATCVLTDSGGIQEETTALGVPCLTLRENTERPITISQGTNTMVGTDRNLILQMVDELATGGGKRGQVPELWDGNAAKRIGAHLSQWLRDRALLPV
jgi:UDP-N-acetylglucosamine 2-epimerase (non-hydrolysing)